jgi:hypothetical protein
MVALYLSSGLLSAARDFYTTIVLLKMGLAPPDFLILTFSFLSQRIACHARQRAKTFGVVSTKEELSTINFLDHSSPRFIQTNLA